MSGVTLGDIEKVSQKKRSMPLATATKTDSLNDNDESVLVKDLRADGTFGVDGIVVKPEVLVKLNGKSQVNMPNISLLTKLCIFYLRERGFSIAHRSNLVVQSLNDPKVKDTYQNFLNLNKEYSDD